MTDLHETPRPNGIYSGISNADYHSDKGSFSSSIIKKMDVPAIARYAMDTTGEYKDQYRIGSAIHAFILEPELFAERHLTGISRARRSAADREAWAEWYAENGWDDAELYILGEKIPAATWNARFEEATGKSMVTPEEIAEIKLMAESVAANSNARELLETGVAEQSVYWRDPETGLNLRARPDFLNGFCSDLKSVQAVDTWTIDRAIVKFGYDISAAMYCDGLKQVIGDDHPFLFIFIQKAPPYLCRVIALSEESFGVGWDKYCERKQRLAECLSTNEWPGLPDDLDHTLFNKSV